MALEFYDDSNYPGGQRRLRGPASLSGVTATEIVPETIVADDAMRKPLRAQAQGTIDPASLRPRGAGRITPPTAVAPAPVVSPERFTSGLRQLRGGSIPGFVAGGAVGLLGKPEPVEQGTPGELPAPLSPTGFGAVPMGTTAEEDAAARARPLGGANSPEPVPFRSPLGIGGNTETTRNVANIVNALVPFAPVSQTLRVGSTAARVVDSVGGAARGLVTAGALSPEMAPDAAVPAQPAQTADPGIGPQQLEEAPAGPAPLNINNSLRPGLMPSDEMRLNAAKLAAAGRVDPGIQGGGIADLGGRGPLVTAQNAEQFAADRNQYLLEQALRLGGRRGAAAASAIADVIRTQSGERVAGARERAETTRASAKNTTDRAIEERRADLTLRGQNVTLRGQDVNAAIQERNNKRIQQNADRQYNLDVQKFGVDVAEKNRAANAAAMKANQDRLESLFRTTDAKGNSTPDHDKIADYQAAVTQTLPAMIRELRATGNPEALKKAQVLEDRGEAALTAQDLAEFKTLFDRRTTVRERSGSLPGAGTYVDSENLLDFRQNEGSRGIDKGLFQDRVSLRGGSSIGVNDLRYSTPASYLPGGDLFKERDADLARGLRLK